MKKLTIALFAGLLSFNTLASVSALNHVAQEEAIYDNTASSVSTVKAEVAKKHLWENHVAQEDAVYDNAAQTTVAQRKSDNTPKHLWGG
ncbi:hypothetical protein A4G18_04445 [Pasteurellaceae bacterium Pebbles2]|nr:hypothetical protein [Pasteurellaceae bacterium Pebbles2]